MGLNTWKVSGKHCHKALTCRRRHIRPNVKGGTGEGGSLKEAPEFEEQGDSFDEIGRITKYMSIGDHSPMNS
jgi:hypothetical protein